MRQMSVRRNLLPLALAPVLLLCCTGCLEWFLSDSGRVKYRTKKFARAITDQQWKVAASYCHSKFTWQRFGSKKKLHGKSAIKGFIKSLAEVRGWDALFVDIHKLKVLEEKKKIEVFATFKIHSMENSMELQFANHVFKARILWVKTSSNVWKLASLKEVSGRARGSVKSPGA